MSTRTRIQSLDVLRGATMAAMVVVNNPGDWDAMYWPLQHAAWHGWTPTDLIFPFFLFIVGVSVTLSRRTFGSWRGVAWRAAIIFGLGVGIGMLARLSVVDVRLPGVLQRIAVCYVAAVAIARASGVGRAGREGRALLALAAWTAGVSLAYWLLLTQVAWGGTAGDLSPDGNLAARVDRAILPGRLYQKTWDPEGLLSTASAVTTTLLGVMAGLLLTAEGGRRPGRGAALALAGGALALAGLWWGGTLPINKSLWTGSYVLFTGGLAALSLAVCHWVVDVRGSRWWCHPFLVLGANPLALFVLSDLIAIALMRIRVPADAGVTLAYWLHQRLFVPLAEPKAASLLYSWANLALLYVVLAALHRRRIFFRV